MADKNIGGQAVLEGVMLREAKSGRVAIANRMQNGKIHITEKTLAPASNKYKFLKFPLVRGVVSFVESLFVGMKTIMDSAELVGMDDEEYKPSKFEKFISEKLKIKLDDVVIGMGVLLGLGLALLLFTFLPTFLTGFLKSLIQSKIALSLIEGLIKIAIFIGYVLLAARQKDVKRVFMYHGAEHKTINCYEDDCELTVENVRNHTRIHPRCGTSFMFYVMFVSIILFAFIPWKYVSLRVLYKLLLLPVVAGISYEIIRFSGKSKSKIVRALSVPGTLLQKITTAEPDDDQIEIGIASLKTLLGEHVDGTDAEEECEESEIESTEEIQEDGTENIQE